MNEEEMMINLYNRKEKKGKERNTLKIGILQFYF